MLERAKCEMASIVCSGGEGETRRQLGLGEAWPDQEAPGVKSKMESSCKEKREAGEQSHMRLRTSKTEFALMTGVLLISKREEVGMADLS